jgi:SEC-C motif-containing protein
MTSTTCACGSEKKYESCCGPYIAGDKPAPTAEALMRARYTAYTRQAIDFIANTHDPKGPNDFDPKAALSWSTTAEWMGLEIKDTDRGREGDTEGMVEFVARFKVNGNEEAHHERSFFRRDKDKNGVEQWYYLDGKAIRTPVRRTEPKVGRNDPCHCGSGKKFKKCCG